MTLDADNALARHRPHGCPRRGREGTAPPPAHACPSCGFEWDDSMLVIVGVTRLELLPGLLLLLSLASLVVLGLSIGRIVPHGYVMGACVVLLLLAVGWSWRRGTLSPGAALILDGDRGAALRLGRGPIRFHPWDRFDRVLVRPAPGGCTIRLCGRLRAGALNLWPMLSIRGVLSGPEAAAIEAEVARRIARLSDSGSAP